MLHGGKIHMVLEQTSFGIAVCVRVCLDNLRI